jgi:DNA-binding response OmpR family regulator
MSRPKILVVDDDITIRELVHALLEGAGYAVRTAADGRSGLRDFHADPPDLVVLDVMMPELDGWQTLERIRDLSDVPVLMLTARSAELERVRGLRAGGDDYVTKPFGRQELVARVDALLRRTRHAVTVHDVYADDDVEIDFAQRSVVVAGVLAALTPLEFKLLGAFVHHPNQVLSRDQLLDLVWGDRAGASSHQVKLYVGYLRRKIGPDRIETVRGFGYRYRRSDSTHTAGPRSPARPFDLAPAAGAVPPVIG